MFHAFKDLGYEIHEITGYGKKRLASIKELKTKLNNGEKFEFLYSETSTMPMFLTERNHLPLYFFVELILFNLCKRFNIPTAIYYRDIHWKFDLFQRGTSWTKRKIALLFYYLELLFIRFSGALLFLPSLEMQSFIPILRNLQNVAELPPGIPKELELSPKTAKSPLHLIYVGGINPPLYDISILLNAVKNSQNAHLHLVCRKEELKNIPASDLTHERIKLHHASGNELAKIYELADIAVVILGNHPYHKFSMPVKLFEAMGYGKPVITMHSMETVSRLVFKLNSGYVVTNQTELTELLNELEISPEKLIDIQNRLPEIRKKLSWTFRAMEVKERLRRSPSNA